jgi:RNA polymerase sigma-70 factor (ECF subfamily)
VTVRVARRRLRARRVRLFFGLERSIEYERAVDPRAAPDECALLAKVYRVLEGVPAEKRIAWSLHRIEGEPLERVAELCGCSLATAKRRIAAANEVIQKAVSHA